MWKPEVRYSLLDMWTPGNTACYYEVLRYVGGIVTVSSMVAMAGPPYSPLGSTYDHDCQSWSDDGFEYQDGCWIRFVPVP